MIVHFGIGPLSGIDLKRNQSFTGRTLATYIDTGKSAPALEFLSPIKGPSLEQITVATGSGQMDAATAAANYDKDVEKQAKQLGLPGW